MRQFCKEKPKFNQAAKTNHHFYRKGLAFTLNHKDAIGQHFNGGFLKRSDLISSTNSKTS